MPFGRTKVSITTQITRFLRRSALEMLVALGRKQRCAIMCAEAVWWRCHRRIITDYLLARGETVFHILDENHIEPARLTEAANPGPDGSLIYPAAPSG